jgi:hypothetical protein
MHPHSPQKALTLSRKVDKCQLLPNSAASVRPRAVSGRSWSLKFRRESAVELSLCRSMIMRSGEPPPLSSPPAAAAACVLSATPRDPVALGRGPKSAPWHDTPWMPREGA